MSVMRKIATSAIVLLCLAPTLVAADMDAYFASAIWNGQDEAIEDGVLLVADGKVRAVGRRSEVDIPSGTARHELGNVTLIPGLVVAQTNLVESARSQEFAINPQVRAVDGFDPFDDYDALLAAGITTIQISPGGDRLMPGQGAVVKLSSDDPSTRVLSEVESLGIVLKRDAFSPPTVYEPEVGAVSVDRPVEPTRPQLATSLAQAKAGLSALFAAAVEGDSSSDPIIEALARIRASKIPIRWDADSNAEILAALELSGEFGAAWIIVDPQEVEQLVSQELWQADEALGVLLTPELRPGRITNPNVPRAGQKTPEPVWVRAKRLAAAGAADKLALRASTDTDLEQLLYLASLFGRGGFTDQQILSMLTSNPASILGVADRVGTLKLDADADFVVLSGRPFANATEVLATYVSGKTVFKHKQNDSESALIHAGRIYTPDGIVSGSVSVADGKIAGVGSSVSVPRGALVRDFGDAVVVPGMLDCATTLGIGGALGDQLSLDTKLGELLARDDEQMALAREGGVTTVLLSSTRLPSPVLAYKLSDQPRALKDPVAIKFQIQGNLTAAEASLRKSLGAGKAYAETWTKYDADYKKYQAALKEYEIAKKKYDADVAAAKKKSEAKKAEEEKSKDGNNKSNASDGKTESASSKKPESNKGESGKDESKKESGKDSDAKADGDSSKETEEDGDKDSGEKDSDDKQKPDDDAAKLVEPKKPEEPKKPKLTASMEPYRALFARKIAALVELSDPKAVDIVVDVFRKEFNLKTAMISGSVASRNAAVLAEHDIFAIVGPAFVGTEKGQLVNFAGDLAVAGVPFGFQSNSSTGVKELPAAVSYSVFEGLGEQDALRGLTVSPAEFLGLASIAKIEAGLDADLVVLSGPPTELSSEVLAVMIDGNWVYEKDNK